MLYNNSHLLKNHLNNPINMQKNGRATLRLRKRKTDRTLASLTCKQPPHGIRAAAAFQL